MEFTFPDDSITKLQYDSILYEIKNNIYGILEVTRNNIHDEREKQNAEPQYNPNPNIIQVCAGLLTYALEEFGKYKLLEECKPKVGRVDLIPIRKHFFNHEAKFEIARQNLPEKCFTIYDSSGADAFWSEIILDIQYPMGWVENTEADFATRLDIFNVGIENTGEVRPSPTINFDDLEVAIEEFYNEFLKIS